MKVLNSNYGFFETNSRGFETNSHIYDDNIEKNRTSNRKTCLPCLSHSPAHAEFDAASNSDDAIECGRSL